MWQHLVRMTTSPRRPRSAIQRPSTRSHSPPPYRWALSKVLIPASYTWSSRSKLYSSSAELSMMVPCTRRDTGLSTFAMLPYSMGAPQVCQWSRDVRRGIPVVAGMVKSGTVMPDTVMPGTVMPGAVMPGTVMPGATLQNPRRCSLTPPSDTSIRSRPGRRPASS